MLPVYSNDKYKVKGIFRIREKILEWLRLILSDTNSRNLFLFLLLNFSFAFVELFYGIWTNSLGLISDSFHMFFDCTALVAGLLASVIMKWKPDDRFTYGYVRAETISGFVNGLFLVFVAFFIFKEAVERVMEPPEVKHDRLFIISVIGLIVNLVGIFVFHHGGHGHSHDHGGHGHSHSNSHSHSHTPDHSHSFVTNHEYNSTHIENNHANNDHMNFITVNGQNSTSNHNHSHHHHSHNGSGGSQIMKGVFLHILADTLGSVGVIVSAFLMSQFDMMIADPICSIFIATLILISVYPLLKDSVSVLMQRIPHELEISLSGCHRKVMELQGVLNVPESHFWTLCSGVYVGSVKIEVSSRADFRFIQMHTQNIYNQAGVKKLNIQIDYVQM